MARNGYVGNLVGSMLGEVLEVDLEMEEVEWGDYMRVRVQLDITKPLQCRKSLKVSE